ncbi:MAG TPA: hypothetical protein P5293_01835, partial [Bacteroidales bacterium]|nr:hypothetical protein [Bacteroidales bacterium]
MKLNVENFKSVLQKATLNFSIESVQLKLTADKIQSRMLMQNSKDAIVILDVPNDVFELKKVVDFTLNFSEPSISVMPYLTLIESDEEVDVRVFDEKITITSGNQKSNIFFCSPNVVTTFSASAPRDNVNYFVSFDLNKSFVIDFNKIKKIGMRFGKIYFTVINKVFAMETTDKLNPYSNTLKFDLLQNVKEDDLSLCFDYR